MSIFMLIYDAYEAAFSPTSFLYGNVFRKWFFVDFSVSLFPPELSEEEAEDVLFKEVSSFLF